MSLFIATIALSSALQGNREPEVRQNVADAALTDASASASLGASREWFALLDRQRWEESWDTAATLFKSQITATQWASMVRTVRQSLGQVSSRTFQSATKANSLPGAPVGEYEVLLFKTNFAGKSNAVETVTLAYDPSGWKVLGYFIR